MFKVEISTENDVFGEDYMDNVVEIKRILEKIIAELDYGFINKTPILDLNGNKVGYWELTED